MIGSFRVAGKLVAGELYGDETFRGKAAEPDFFGESLRGSKKPVAGLMSKIISSCPTRSGAAFYRMIEGVKCQMQVVRSLKPPELAPWLRNS